MPEIVCQYFNQVEIAFKISNIDHRRCLCTRKHGSRPESSERYQHGYSTCICEPDLPARQLPGERIIRVPVRYSCFSKNPGTYPFLNGVPALVSNRTVYRPISFFHS